MEPTCCRELASLLTCMASSAVMIGVEEPPGMTAFSVRTCVQATGVLEDNLAQRNA